MVFFSSLLYRTYKKERKGTKYHQNKNIYNLALKTHDISLFIRGLKCREKKKKVYMCVRPMNKSTSVSVTPDFNRESHHTCIKTGNHENEMS